MTRCALLLALLSGCSGHAHDYRDTLRTQCTSGSAVACRGLPDADAEAARETRAGIGTGLLTVLSTPLTILTGVHVGP
jgi:hypothetical protein